MTCSKATPRRHPIALALRRQDDVDDARVTKNETLVRRGRKWFRYDAPDKRLFKELQKTLPRRRTNVSLGHAGRYALEYCNRPVGPQIGSTH
jgi:hypothetical protein